MPYLPEPFKVEKETAHYFHPTAQTNAHPSLSQLYFLQQRQMFQKQKVLDGIGGT